MAVQNEDPEGSQPYYKLKHFKFPVFEPIIRANGFCYATIDRKIMREAIEWADVVHLEEYFPLQIVAADIARELGKPCVSTFHVFVENVTANLGMSDTNPINRFLMRVFKKYVYDRCSDIHCPSETVKQYLLDCGFTNRLHVISNGMIMPEDPVVAKMPGEGPYTILCIGRLAREKSQETLLDAMRHSKHSQDIRLVFAGNGPLKKKYERISSRLVADGVLKHAPEFGFFTHGELCALAREAYLYVHCAYVEVEGLSCLEAIREGVVPLIGEGRLVATSQFALDDRSRYPARDPKALAEKIDWWIEHPEVRREMGQKYADSVKIYGDRESTASIISMYELAVSGR